MANPNLNACPLYSTRNLTLYLVAVATPNPRAMPAPRCDCRSQDLPCCYFYTESFLFWLVALGLALAIANLAMLFEILGFTLVRR